MADRKDGADRGGAGPEGLRIVDIGANVRARRTDQGLSLRELARRIGISASALSQIEIGRSRPNVDTLYAISQHLGVTPNEIFFGTGVLSQNSGIGTEVSAAEVSDRNSTPRSIVAHTRFEVDEIVELVRRGSQQSAELRGGETCRQIGGLSLPGVDCLLITYEAGAVSPSDGDRVTHAGREFNYLLSGSLVVDVDGEEYELWPGDSLTFSSELPHRFYNKGETEARVVCFVLRTWMASHGRTDKSLKASEVTSEVLQP